MRPDAPVPTAGRDGRTGRRRALAAGCLLLPFVGLLGVPWYARAEPRLGGIPFFYWYQMLWIPLSALLMGAAYLLVRRRPPRNLVQNSKETAPEQGR